MSRTQVELWHNRFKEGREDVNDVASTGHPSTPTSDENIEALKKMILHNRRINSVRLMLSNFCGCFRDETCDSEDCFKIDAMSIIA